RRREAAVAFGRRAEGVALDVDVDALVLRPLREQQRRVADDLAEHGLRFGDVRLVRRLREDAHAGPGEPRPEQPGDEEERERDVEDERAHPDDVGGGLRQRADGEADADHHDGETAGEVDGEQDSAPGGACLSPATGEEHEDAEEDEDSEHGEAVVQRVLQAAVVVDQEAVRGAVLTAVLAVEQRRKDGRERRDHPQPGHEASLHRPLQPARRIREQQLEEHRQVDRAEREAERVEERVVRGPERREDEEEDAGHDEQPAGVVARAQRPADEAAEDEREAGERRDPGPDDALVVRHDAGDDVERDEDGGDASDREPEDAGPGHSTSAESAEPESSALGMNPAAPLRATSGPKSAASRLETSTTIGPSPFPVSSAATAKPSTSGSWTSSRTRSGRSRRAASSADAPSTASPTTSNPSARRSARAVSRKDGWSSTIRTLITLRIVAQRVAAGQTANHTIGGGGGYRTPEVPPEWAHG